MGQKQEAPIDPPSSRPRILLVALVMGLDDETLELLLKRSAWMLELVRHELQSRKEFDKEQKAP